MPGKAFTPPDAQLAADSAPGGRHTDSRLRQAIATAAVGSGKGGFEGATAAGKSDAAQVIGNFPIITLLKTTIEAVRLHSRLDHARHSFVKEFVPTT